MRAVGVLSLLMGCTPGCPQPPVETGGHDSADSGTDTGEPPVVDGVLHSVEATVDPDMATLVWISWYQRSSATQSWVTYWVEGGEEHRTPTVAADVGDQDVALLGIPAQHTVSYQIHSQLTDGTAVASQVYSTQTGALPDALHTPVLIQAASKGSSPQDHVLLSVDMGDGWFQGPFYVLLVNREGEVVWYRKTSDSRCSMFTRVSRSGDHVLIDASTLYTFDNALRPTVTRLTLDGRHSMEVEVPQMHYAFDEEADGSLLYGAASSDRDFHLDRMRPDGTVERIWSCYPWMKPYSDAMWACAVNAVFWRADTNTVLWSMFETSTVAEVDLDSGTVVRHFGQLPDGYAFDPPESVFDLQHAPNVSADGTLMVSTHIIGDDFAQRAREYAIDDDQQTLTEVWSYGAQSDAYARYAGEAQRLSNGNVLVNYGTDGILREVSTAGETLWEIEWHDRLIGHATLIDDLYALNAWGGEGWVLSGSQTQ